MSQNVDIVGTLIATGFIQLTHPKVQKKIGRGRLLVVFGIIFITAGTTSKHQGQDHC